MSGLLSWKSAEIGLFRPFSAFFGLFRRARTAPEKSRKRRKKAFFLRYPRICLNPHLLNPHLRHSNSDGLFWFRVFFWGGGVFLPLLITGPCPQYGWDFPEEIPERPRKRSQSVSWNSPREYGWDPPNTILQGI